MQLKHYNALMTRTVHRGSRGEAANEVTTSRFSVDPATVFQPPRVATDRWRAARETTRRRGQRNSSSSSRSFFPLSSWRHRFSRSFPEQKPRLEREREKGKKRLFSSVYVSWKNVSSSLVSWITVLTTVPFLFFYERGMCYLVANLDKI